MPRYPKKTKPEGGCAAPFAGERVDQDRGPKVERHLVSARRLITLSENAGVWMPNGVLPGHDEGFWEGAIVRLRPPHDVDPERLEIVRACLAKAGVVRVKLELRRGVVVPTEAVRKASAYLADLERKKPARATAREVVLQLVSESNSSDVDALREVVDRIMGEEGI